jgi:L-asparaginase/Glu-tRNA(Gln) amidotransferase subunit D
MDFDPRGLIASIGLPDVDLEFRSIFRKGSMDIVPGDWVVLAEAVAQAIALRPRGVVILHGTDTMHYSASALAFMLRDLGVPVVMTGSMIPGGDSGSDAWMALPGSCAGCASTRGEYEPPAHIHHPARGTERHRAIARRESGPIGAA